MGRFPPTPHAPQVLFLGRTLTDTQSPGTAAPSEGQPVELGALFRSQEPGTCHNPQSRLCWAVSSPTDITATPCKVSCASPETNQKLRRQKPLPRVAKSRPLSGARRRPGRRKGRGCAGGCRQTCQPRTCLTATRAPRKAPRLSPAGLPAAPAACASGAEPCRTQGTHGAVCVPSQRTPRGHSGAGDACHSFL